MIQAAAEAVPAAATDEAKQSSESSVWCAFCLRFRTVLSQVFEIFGKTACWSPDAAAVLPPVQQAAAAPAVLAAGASHCTLEAYTAYF